MKAQNTNLKVLVANATSDPTETTMPTFKTSGSTGEVLVVERDGTAIAAGSTGIMIAVKKADGTLDQTEVIPTAGIVKASVKSYAAGTNQVDYIGFNGTSGSIDAVNATHYIANLRMQEFGSMSASNYENLVGEFYTDASAIQAEIADGICSSLVASHDELNQEKFLIERVINNAGVSLTSATGNITAVKGSKILTVATDADAEVAIGDHIRLGTTAGAAVTDAAYKVVSFPTATTIKLDVPFQGDSATFTVTNCDHVDAATAASADFGVRLTARDLTAVAGKFPVQKFHFSTSLENFGSTTLTAQSTGASVGIGSGAQVREHEWFARGNFGEIFRTGQPHLFDNELVGVSGNNYDVLSIDYYLDERERLTYTSSPRSLVVYVNEASSSAAMNALIGDLNNNTVSSELSALTSI